MLIPGGTIALAFIRKKQTLFIVLFWPLFLQSYPNATGTPQAGEKEKVMISLGGTSFLSSNKGASKTSCASQYKRSDESVKAVYS